jgi:Leucine-rich repeat (LRR) protein
MQQSIADSVDTSICKTDNPEQLHTITVLVEYMHSNSCAHMLSKLTELESLILPGKGLVDVDILRYATNLQYLNLRNNSIYSINLMQMKQLEYLDISGNPINNVASEAIQTLQCNHCEIHSLSNIQTPLVESLYLRNNQIVDLHIEHMTHLRHVLLTSNLIVNIEDHESLQKLEVLDIVGNPILQKDCPNDKGTSPALRKACMMLEF